MKKLFLFIISCLILINFGFGQEYFGTNANQIIPGSKHIWKNSNTSIPAFIEFDAQHYIKTGDFKSWILKTFNLDSKYDFILVNTTDDELGFTHYKYQEYFSGYPVDKAFYLLHTKNGLIISLNGLIFDNISVELSYNLKEADALSSALQNIKANVYKWQIPDEEQLIKQQMNDSGASYFPKGELVLINKNIQSSKMRVAYKFNIYAEEPLSRAYYYIDASTGEMLFTDPIIHHANSIGTAYTKYSGKQTIITDSFAAGRFRLRETDRGNGIQTFNMQKGTNYNTAVDFIDSDNVWNQFNANWDEAATDAHWGSEMTYDFYKSTFNRNSLDNKGLLLKSYVHYSVNYANAFWNGTVMTYGDGTNGKPFTLVDITGHEMTHGVTSFTAQLPGSGEGGALNESYSDIFGKSVEYYAKPLQSSWTIGGTVIPIRNMANPKTFSNPNTYKGQYWDSINMEVHDNSTPQSYCFYLLCMGGSGTNDLGHTYSVTAIGRDKAERIFYRALTTYLTSTSVYADSRFYTIKAAGDLYGECSPEVSALYEAWYAIGLGINKRQVSFHSNQYFPDCHKNFTVNFINTSDEFSTFTWYFGDGQSASSLNASHTYANYGVYSVKLVGISSCDTDSTIINNYVVLDSNAPCPFLITKTLGSSSLCSGLLFDDGGISNYSSNFNGSFTISVPTATAIVLNFKSFSFEDCGNTDCDYIKIYDGPNTSASLIGKYTGNTLPNGGTIHSTGNSITIQEHTDTLNDMAGFELQWQCIRPIDPPVADFTSNPRSSCSGNIQFSDLSVNNPSSWMWYFGDGATSSLRNPSHLYYANGIYTVRLIATNANGSDTMIKNNFITINMDPIPGTGDTSICGNKIVTLNAGGYDKIYWYNTGIPTASPIDSGVTFTTPLITSSISYWVQGMSNVFTQNVGPVDNTFSTGSYYTSATSHFEIFDAYTDLTILSVKVFANSTANRTFLLTDSNGVILKDTTVNLHTGTDTVNLNFDVPKENSLRLGALGSNNLYRNRGGASYPYQIAGVIKIRESDVAPQTPNYYYFVYDWALQIRPCKSLRKKIDITLDTVVKADFTYSSAGLKITFQNTSKQGNYFWSFGDGKTDTSRNPQHTYASAGGYTVRLVVKNACNSDTITKTVNVSASSIGMALTHSDMYIYPNPATESINIKITSNTPDKLYLKFINSLGQAIFEKAIFNNSVTLENIKVNNLSKGIYFIQLSDESKTMTRMVIIE